MMTEFKCKRSDDTIHVQCTKYYFGTKYMVYSLQC